MRLLPEYYRIPYDHITESHGKRYHPNFKKQVFKQRLVITEKLDGSQVAVGFKNGRVYLQGKGSHIMARDKRHVFHGLFEWVAENSERIEKLKGKLIFGEWLRVYHNISYDLLPDWFIGFAVWDMKLQKFMDFHAGRKFISDLGFSVVPILYEGKIKYKDLPGLIEGRLSCYSSSHYMEGCVLMPERNPKYNQVKDQVYWINAAKLVVQEFFNDFRETDWTSDRMTENALNRGFCDTEEKV